MLISRTFVSYFFLVPLVVVSRTYLVDSNVKLNERVHFLRAIGLGESNQLSIFSEKKKKILMMFRV